MTQEPTFAFNLCRFLEPQGIFQGPLNRLQRRMLAFYISEQARREIQKDEEDFKSLYFALVQRNNPDVYKEIFKSEEQRELEEAEASVGYATPESEHDLQRMYREMRRMGLMKYADGSEAAI